MSAARSGAPARLAAARLLARVLKQRCTVEDASSQEPSLQALDPNDRNFARAMALAALREFGRIDIGLAAFLKRESDSLAPLVRALLQIGAAQLWRLGTPAHAAVAATVEAARSERATARAAGLVNAVLRRAAESRAAFDAAPLLDVWPDWLQALMIESLGREGAEALASAQLHRPDLNLTARAPEAIAERLGGRLLPSGSVALEMAQVETLPGYSEGDWWVQDAAAALPARLLAPRPDEYIIDLCAAPGGKTLQLANAGARVTAVDRSTSRLGRLRENLARTRLGQKVGIVAASALDWRPDRPVDAVLLDAPCSALGTLARHPEGAWIRRAADLEGYPALQAKLLAAARDMLKPGGRLVYCVCTPLRAEGKEVIAAALAGGGWRRAAVRPEEAPGFAAGIDRDGDVLTLPGPQGGHDAFFMARLIRAKS